MMFTAVADLGFGDGGKGKVTDILAEYHDACVRYNGGANAGHSVETGDADFALHLLPSGVLRGLTGVLAAGMVVDPIQLWNEIELIEDKLGRKIDLKIAYNCHCVMPWHLQADAKKGHKIGTTKRGIGPAYADKMHRWNAIRMGNLHGQLQDEALSRFFAADEVLHGKGLWEKYTDAAWALKQYVTDTRQYLRQSMKDGKNILFEMANGIHLDVDWGTYPYVTSSGTGPAAIPQSCGLPNLHLNKIVGVMKCYMTRVGEGPFPSEIWSDDCEGTLMWLMESTHGQDMTRAEIRDLIRNKGKEFGTTTGRPRRIGWLDIDKTKEAVELTGATELAVMHADTLCGLKQIGARIDGKEITIDGWVSLGDPNFRSFLEWLEQKLEVPVSLVSHGPGREDTIFTDKWTN